MAEFACVWLMVGTFLTMVGEYGRARDGNKAPPLISYFMLIFVWPYVLYLYHRENRP